MIKLLMCHSLPVCQQFSFSRAITEGRIVVSNNEDYEMPARPRRGTALLVGTIVVVAMFAFALLAPGAVGPAGKAVRVAVIDSGIDAKGILWLTKLKWP